MNTVVDDASLALGIGLRGLFNQMVSDHPQKFSNQSEVSHSWWKRYIDNRYINPYCHDYCRRVVDTHDAMHQDRRAFVGNPTEHTCPSYPQL